MIANSGHDENGNYHGGKAGDQGGENIIQAWYSRPWLCDLRHPDATVRSWIATLAEEMANNNNFGYDQWNRLSGWNALQKASYRPKNVNTPVEGDCSANVAAIVKCVGYLLNITALKDIDPNLTTFNMREAFIKAGFQCLTASKYLTSDKYELRGDILLNDDHHVAVNLTNGSATTTNTATYAEPTTTIQSGSKGNGVKWVQTMLNKYGYGLEVDGSCGKLTTSAIKDFQRKHGLEVDGKVGPKTRAALKGTVTSNPYSTPTVNVKKGSKGNNVKWVQWELNRLGYGLDIDGDFGSKTDAAVRAFQKAKKLTVDGIVGKNTRAALKAS